MKTFFRVIEQIPSLRTDSFSDDHVTWEIINSKNLLPMFGEYKFLTCLTTTSYKILLGLHQYFYISSSGITFFSYKMYFSLF